MCAPPKKARGELASKTARKLTTPIRYSALAVLAKFFGWPFWFFESHRVRLADHIENERDDEGDER